MTTSQSTEDLHKVLASFIRTRSRCTTAGATQAAEAIEYPSSIALSFRRDAAGQTFHPLGQDRYKRSMAGPSSSADPIVWNFGKDCWKPCSSSNNFLWLILSQGTHEPELRPKRNFHKKQTKSILPSCEISIPVLTFLDQLEEIRPPD
jgi:hypothetical protein